MIRHRPARRRFDREWAAQTRDVRASLAAATVEMVNREVGDRALTDHTAVEITAQIWADMTDLMYPPKEHQP